MGTTTTSQPPRWKISLILAVGILAVSTAAVLIRLAIAAADQRGVGFSLVLAALRLTTAAFILLPGWAGFRLQTLPRSALLYSGTAGVFLAIHFGAWITSLSYTSVAASTALVTTNPVWVALLSWVWFRERPSTLTNGGIAIALIGSIIISLSSEGQTAIGTAPMVGNFLALVGSWAVSFYFLLGREAQRNGLTIGNHAVLAYTTAALTLLPLPLLFGATYTGYPTAVYLYIFLIALFPQVVGHTSLNWAVRWVSPTLVTLTILAEPVGSSLLAFLVFRENPGVQVLLGAGVILLGVAIAAWGTRSTAASSG